MMSHDKGSELLSSVTALKDDLPFSPQILTTLFAQTDEDSKASLGDIADSIAADQGLTVKVLSMANSAYYGLQSEVESPARAVSLLGLETIRCLVLGIGVKGLAAKMKRGVLDLKKYWRHQLITAATAKHIACHVGTLPLAKDAEPLIPDQIFTAGMLHDFGKLLTALLRPEDWERITQLAQDESLSIAEAEDEYWGLEHGVVGAMALRSMNLPPSLTEPVNWHHAPTNAPDHVLHAKILCLADAMAVRFDGPDRKVAGPWESILEEFDLDADTLMAEVAELAEDEGISDLLRALT